MSVFLPMERLAWVGVLLVIWFPLNLGAEEPVSYNRNIRPLLEKNCMACHGGIKRRGGFSFLFPEEILGKGKSGKTLVVPGEPDASELVYRIQSTDLKQRMPPPKANPHGLEQGDIELLKQWIRQGGFWEPQWALQKPVNHPLPEETSSWPKAELDRFVLMKLKEKGLQPSEEAPAAEWLRRVSLDLTGLPPSLQEWDLYQQAAANDPDGAKAAAVNRLLTSPHFGERWASMWLDLARYADTTGFERDPHRDVWPFRDWVIQAFNSDMPYDQFTIKQLAGDLLTNPEPGDLMATAFHRNTKTNAEGGSDDEEFRVAATIDRVNTTWTAWQGTTFACAQCHDHPSEPIRQTDYYRFLAFFDQTEDADLNDDFPTAKLTEESSRQVESDRLAVSIRKLREDLNTEGCNLAMGIKNWRPVVFEKTISDSAEGSLQQQADGMVIANGTNPTVSTYTLSCAAVPFAALKLDIFPEDEDPKKWQGQGQVLSRIEADLVNSEGRRRAVSFREVVADYLAGPFDPNESLHNGPEGFGDYPMTRGPRTAWFVPESPVIPGEGDSLEIRLLQSAVCNGNQQSCILRRFRLSLTQDRSLSEKLATLERVKKWTAYEALNQQYQSIPGTTLPVMRERGDAAYRSTRVFVRGNRLTKSDAVSPAIPAYFGGKELTGTGNRLDVAKWLISEENPLTARVLANRLWAELFGVGLVESQEDFGQGGTPPSNQALLDHLALRLRVQHQWHIKPFLREIVLSSTYRQTGNTGNTDAARLAADPANRFLSRGPRQRLTAEMIRDQGLAVSGLLCEKMAGPPVFPPQPDGIWRTVNSAATWIDSTGEDRYRRAIYTYVKRTSGYPASLIFDAPDREACSARRIVTNTPLQALVTLNDPAHLEFARQLAKRMQDAGTEVNARIVFAYRLLFLKEPSADVVEILSRLHRDLVAQYKNTPGEVIVSASSPEEAAWVVVASTLLNSDAALTR